MRALSIRIRNLCVHWAYASGTYTCTEHTHQELMLVLSIRISVTRMLSISVKIQEIEKVPSKHAELTRKELMRALSIRIRNLSVH
jgi:hypothetical protein